MRVVVFLTVLCCLLLRGYSCVYTGSYKDRISYSPVRSIENSQGAKQTKKDQGDTISAADDEETDYLISDDLEDEETNNLSARKYRLLTRRCIIPSHSFSYLYGIKDRPFFCGLLSNKYITQRVLRI